MPLETSTEDDVAGSRRWRQRDDLRLKPINVEKGTRRYSEKDGVFPPTAAAWRNNLTALSQRLNLLFVAYNHQIFVWEPAGPLQTLGATPEMIITPVMKEPDAEGFISVEFPHAINNILVDDLGRDEVLLLTTDSGNVCGYHVDSIFSYLELAKSTGERRPIRNPHVDPVFCEHVVASAWGLAVHKLARLIAVSANTGLITVFAFALVDAQSEEYEDTESHLDLQGDDQDYGQNWLNVDRQDQFLKLRRLMPHHHRSTNIRLTLAGHHTNIPNVGFLNCDLDPNGMWMVSTDIDNKLFIWRIWDALSPFNVYDFSSFSTALHHHERGWNVIALDPRTFRLSRSYFEACGGQPFELTLNRQSILDVTNLSRSVPDASHRYDYFPPAVRTEPEEPVFPDIFDGDCCVGGSSHSDIPSLSRTRESHSDENLSDHGDIPGGKTRHGRKRARKMNDGDDDPRLAVSETEIGDNEDTSAVHGGNDQSGRGQDGDTFTSAAGLDDSVTHEPFPSTMLQFFFEGLLGDDPSESNSEVGLVETADFSLAEIGQGSESDELGESEHEESDWFGSEMEGDRPNSDLDSSLPTDEAEQSMLHREHEEEILGDLDRRGFMFPILHFSETDIRLIPNPLAPYPSVIASGTLRQTFTQMVYSIHSYDRFNMVKYIPELGVVIAATQKGRAAVISLTEVHQKGPLFRINWMVPLESQERYGDRPHIPLLGIAASPVQGYEKPCDVSYVPHRSSDENELTFHYRFHDDATSDSKKFQPRSQEVPNDEENVESSSQTSSDEKGSKLTLPECHGSANRNHQPHEQWQGWNPSRRYRLLLMYGDHTVMSYEFWYEWSNAVAGENYNPSVTAERDEFLLL